MQQDDDRLITTSMREQEDESELTLRPRTLAEYYGQTRVKETLSVFIQAAVKRHEPLDHLLLYGPPGLGKTTLACIIASEMGQNIRTTSGPAIERPGDLASILTNLNQGDILFIDFALDIMIGKGPSARSLRLDLPKFTLIGATTRAGMLSSPLRDRFGISFRLELYRPEELATIVMRSAKILKIDCDREGALEIARRSRGTPRISNRLIKRVRDFAQVRGDGMITREAASEALDALEVDTLGLDKTDRNMLATMIKKFGGGPVGLDTLAASTGEDAGTIEDVYEPYLMQLGFMMRTPRGRVLTPAAYEHMKMPMPQTDGINGQLRFDFGDEE